MAISGGYSVSHRAATAYGRGGDDFGSLNSTGYNANISVTRATRPTPNAQDPVMYLSERLSELHRDAAELRPVAAEQPGLRPAHHR